ncbi:hypothetical protein B7463_g7411, partial [Scytalidium lignicola]
MEVHLRNVPKQATENSLRKFFDPLAKKIFTGQYYVQKLRGKNYAFLVFLIQEDGERFLLLYGTPSSSNPRINLRVQHQPRLMFMGVPIYPNKSNRSPDKYLVKVLQKEHKDRAEHVTKVEAGVYKSHEPNSRHVVFSCSGISCGVWKSIHGRALYSSEWDYSWEGKAKFGRNCMILTFGTNHRIEFRYNAIDYIVSETSPAPSITITMKEAPRLEAQLDIIDLFAGMKLKQTKISSQSRSRLPFIDELHQLVVGSCFVYRLHIQTYDIEAMIDDLQELRTTPDMPSIIHMSTKLEFPLSGWKHSDQWRRLQFTLSASQVTLPFVLKFQLQALAQNGYLRPEQVLDLIPVVESMAKRSKVPVCIAAIQKLVNQIQWPGPGIEEQLETKTPVEYLLDNEKATDEQFYTQRNAEPKNIATIHRAVITPTGNYLYGPDTDTNNRVLRKYANHHEFFLRVQFCEEDGDIIRFNPRVSNDRIFNGRFKEVLERGLDIAGRHYSFLGFSHSSLRAQSCWFVAPFQGPDGKFVTATSIIDELGDFSNIRSPAKCAARIGQAFTDTPIAVPLTNSTYLSIPDVERNGRVFSDGVGTMSSSVMHTIWGYLPRNRAQDQPTCYQIRWKGAKGMIALDTRLPGHTLCIRPSMVKFEGSVITDIEICGASYKPLPMYLSRQLIKILEDLEVDENFFFKLQQREVKRLRSITESPYNTISYLRSKAIGERMDLPWLISTLYSMKIDFRQDVFLRDIVEMAVLMDLRLLKYKARIPVEKGYHLHGIMDETGILEEGEIFCIVTKDGVPTVLEQNRVVVSRAPALHPGDIQVAKAVKVPHDSPLMSLTNCICFSQKGYRDLPSKLSGGDLDGDLYYIMWGRDAMPKKISTAADYPRVAPLDIRRPVVHKDMTDFFIKFMETDQLGRICTSHEILADQSEKGTCDSNCVLLAELASTAVDFSKTGIPPDMERMPLVSKWRPDFMAHGPHVNISKKGEVMFHDPQILDEEEDEDLAGDLPTFRYYESDKILGKLFRNVDERTIFDQIKKHSLAYETSSGETVLGKVWSYVGYQAQGFQWEHHVDEAKSIRDEYESSLLNIIAEYSDHPRRPITELEVIVGNILGKTGVQTSRQRDLSLSMKGQFNELSTSIIQWIRHGEEEASMEAMERSIACLKVAMEPRSSRRGIRGLSYNQSLMSFKYLAAAVCLREVQRVW